MADLPAINMLAYVLSIRHLSSENPDAPIDRAELYEFELLFGLGCLERLEKMGYISLLDGEQVQVNHARIVDISMVETDKQPLF